MNRPDSLRSIGPDKIQCDQMLDFVGYKDLDSLVESVVPEDIVSDIPDFESMTQNQFLEYMHKLASDNKLIKTMIGQGYYYNLCPHAITRNVIENPGWYTSYTPYQPEISQGRLEALMNFQTLVSDLTGLPVAGASLLDEATAVAEAMVMAYKASQNNSDKVLILNSCWPQTLDVVQVRAKNIGIDLHIGGIELIDQHKYCGVIFQTPDNFGLVHDLSSHISKLKQQGTIVVVATDLLYLTVGKAPAEMGVDIAVGNSQRFGVPVFYGGPHAAFIATNDDLKRIMPGRIIGGTIDVHGKTAYRMALQTREQHIRREKATSNICTAQALLAIVAGFYAVYHGPEGLHKIATTVNSMAYRFAKMVGACINCFDTVMLKTDAKAAIQSALNAGYNIRYLDSEHVSVSFDQSSQESDLIALTQALGFDYDGTHKGIYNPDIVTRDHNTYLKHSNFHNYRTETNLVRYMRMLSDKDIALDRSMIPLGSCTLKLNPAVCMEATSISSMSNIHPFAPQNQALGYRHLIQDLTRLLCDITGFDGFSLQPNSGAQGEYAALVAIKMYYQSLGQDRDICLIPISAHGTNPASAKMAGLKVATIKCTKEGDIDIKDLKALITKHNSKIALIMVTYPSTHGVFEAEIRNICELMHNCGAQVYIDGANMNAQIGLARPGKFGADAIHLNLHKTFAIPHGGGGPGIGPIGVRKHLEPFLPGHMQLGTRNAVAAAPYGSAGILSISYGYIKMMGSAGLKLSAQVAILSANFIAKTLDPYFKVLYKGNKGLVAHECIIDIRPIQKQCGITNEDIARRLMDYGIHAPTVSFPVNGTLMIEPTESECLNSIKRFLDAMISIRKEIEDIIENGNLKDNQIKNAPHTAEHVCSDTWDHPYTRMMAAYPDKYTKLNKVWPGSGKIDSVYGDRNLCCSVDE